MKTTKLNTLLLAVAAGLTVLLMITLVQLSTTNTRGAMPAVAEDTCAIMQACIPLN